MMPQKNNCHFLLDVINQRSYLPHTYCRSANGILLSHHVCQNHRCPFYAQNYIIDAPAYRIMVMVLSCHGLSSTSDHHAASRSPLQHHESQLQLSMDNPDYCKAKIVKIPIYSCSYNNKLCIRAIARQATSKNRSSLHTNSYLQFFFYFTINSSSNKKKSIKAPLVNDSSSLQNNLLCSVIHLIICKQVINNLFLIQYYLQFCQKSLTALMT